MAGKNGGTGWAGAWFNDTTGLVASGSLGYSDGTNTLVTSGNSFAISGNDRYMRDFASAESGNFWFSFTANASAGLSRVSFSDSGGTAKIFNIEFDTANSLIKSNVTGSLGNTTAFTPGTDMFIIGQITNDGSNISQSIWINPADLTNPTAGSALSDSRSLSGAEIDRIEFTAFSTTDATFDEFRIGADAASVSPIPEPSTSVALAGIIGLAAALYIRRRR